MSGLSKPIVTRLTLQLTSTSMYHNFLKGQPIIAIHQYNCSMSIYLTIHQYIPIHELQYINTSEHNITAALAPLISFSFPVKHLIINNT